MFNFKYFFKPNYEHYEGVRPVNIYLLRLFYFLMAIFVATDSWRLLFNHEGPWDRYRAMTVCVLAAYPTLAVFGVFRPLRWLPIMIFMIFYKTLWLITFAYPLWRANELAGSPSAEMAGVFFAAPFIALIVPWKYVFENFVYNPKKQIT